MESLEEEQKRELLEAEAAKKGQEQGRKVVVKKTIKFCEECSAVVAKIICDVCIISYCEKCFSDKHVGVPWNLHTFSDIDAANNTPRYNSKKSDNSESSGKGGNNSTEKKKKTKKKKKKKENDGDLEVSGDESEMSKKDEEERLKEKADKLGEKQERKRNRQDIRMRKAAKRALLEGGNDELPQTPTPGVLPPIGPEGHGKDEGDGGFGGDDGFLPQIGSEGTVGDGGVLPPIGPEGIFPPAGDDTELGDGILPRIGPEGNLPQI